MLTILESRVKSFGLDVRMGAAIAAEVYLNGALVSDKAPGQMVSQSLAIQHEVVPGRNTLLVIATVAGVSPYSAPRPVTGLDAADCFVELDLETDTVKDIGDSYQITTEPLKDAHWRAAEAGPQIVLPQRITLTFEAEGPLAPPVWTRGRAVQAEAVKAEAGIALADLHRLLEHKDLAGFEDRMRLRNEDMARAYPLSGTAPERAKRDSTALAGELAARGATLAPIDPARLAVRTFADGRIIDVRAPDGHAPLRILVPGQDAVYLPVSFSMIEGRLAAVR